MTYATTFSGIGGWELGLNACGWELKWQCEREPWCRRLLKERFGVPIYSDIRTICDESPPPVDALIGSPPCQPFSVAGAQGGTADERHLYPAFIKLVAHIQPRWVLMEQVPAILAIDGGRAFSGYIGGLVALGYDVCWHCIPACAVGANHQRDRIWIVAHTQHGRLQVGRRIEDSGRDGRNASGICSNVSPSLQQQAGNILAHSQGKQNRRIQQYGIQSNTCPGGKLDSNPSGQGLEGQREIASGIGAQLYNLGDHCGWSTEPNVGRVANGIPSRVDRLKGLGNAVVPQIPFLIGQAINQIENNLT